MTERQSKFLDAFILGLVDLSEHLPEEPTELELRAFDLGKELVDQSPLWSEHGQV